MQAGRNIPFIQTFSKDNKNNIGLYRYDGLAIFKTLAAQNQIKVRKDNQKFFKEN